jgi:hypothetical protein
MTSRLTERFDLIQAAIGLFVVLGVTLTAVAGYALLAPLNFAISTDLTVALLSGVSLLAFAVALTFWLSSKFGRRKPPQSA